MPNTTKPNKGRDHYIAIQKECRARAKIKSMRFVSDGKRTARRGKNYG